MYMISKLFTASGTNTDEFLVQVEVNLLPGQFGIHIVGLGDNAVKESKDRIRSAIVNSGFEFPIKNIIINLAPNDQPKIGSLTELAICVGILIASGQCPQEAFNRKMLLGSLSLDGSLQNTKGMFRVAILAKRGGYIDGVLIPQKVAKELSCIPNLNFYPLKKLRDIRDFTSSSIEPIRGRKFQPESNISEVDMSSIFGQEQAKRALAFAVIGNHHSLLFGSHGTGKTLLANALKGLLPPVNLEESLEITQTHSMRGQIVSELITKRPFRTPHHTTSEVAMVGGGNKLIPGEVSLAHKGVLFLDELFEFRSSTLQAIREPLEDRQITISRAKGSLTFPANFLFIGATNPCRCGYLFSSIQSCSCQPSVRNHLYQKIAGPFEDRIALEIETHELKKQSLIGKNQEKTSQWWRNKIIEARQRMFFRNGQIANNEISSEKLLELVYQVPQAKVMISECSGLLQLSYRSLLQSLRVALTIQDFNESDKLKIEYIEEAFYYKAFKKLRTERLAA